MTLKEHLNISRRGIRELKRRRPQEMVSAVKRVTVFIRSAGATFSAPAFSISRST